MNKGKSQPQVIVENVGYIILIIFGIYSCIDGFSSAVDFLNFRKSIILSIVSISIGLIIQIYFKYKNFTWEEEGVTYRFIKPSTKFNLLLIATLLALWIPLYFKNNLKIPNVEMSKDQLSYKNESNFNILLIPFGSSQTCNESTILCERELKKYFYTNDNFQDEDLEVVIDYSFEEKEKVFRNSELREIAKKSKSDLIIWGDYTKRCEYDSTLVQINYFIPNSDNSELITLSKQQSENQTILDISDISKGQIIGDIKNICFWILGYKKFNEGDYKKALNYFKKVVSIERIEYGQLFFSIALTYQNMGEYEDAIKYYNKVRGLDDTNYMTLNNRGNCFVNIDSFEVALNDFNEGIRLSNDVYADLYLNRAFLYRKMKKFENAIVDLSVAHKIWLKHGSPNPNFYPFILGNLSNTLQVDKLRRLIKDIESALIKFPNNEYLLISKTICLIRLNELKSAKYTIEEILKINSNSAFAMAFRIDVLRKMGDLESASNRVNEFKERVIIPESQNGIVAIFGYQIKIK